MRSSLRTAARRGAVTVGAAVAITAAATGVAGAASAATAAVKSYTSTATTSITNRPDSGDHGNWALDGTQGAPLKRTASVTLVSEVALSYCGGASGTGHCYHWTGKITDAGGFVTVAGDSSPGNGSLNGGGPAPIGTAVTGTMAGVYHYDFYSTWKTANKALVAATENDGGNLPGGNSTTDLWPAKFFGSGAKFYVGGAQSTSLGTTGSWTYKAAAGSDQACPAVSSQWTDGSPDWGASASDGNILAPSAANC